MPNEKFLRLFLDEFRENLVIAEKWIIVLKNDKENNDALSTILRVLHTIKGSARMLKFPDIEKLVHGAENIFKGIREGRTLLEEGIIRLFFIIIDHLRFAADSLEKNGSDSIPSLDTLLGACEKAGAEEFIDFESLRIPETENQKIAFQNFTEKTSAKVSGVSEKNKNQDDIGHDGLNSGKNLKINKNTGSIIRVDLENVDKSINLANTLTIRQLRQRLISGKLESLETALVNVLREMKDLKVIKKEISALSRNIRMIRGEYAERLFEMEQSTQELRDIIISMRMLPLSSILDRFPRMVEDTAQALGKEIELEITGDSARVDSAVLSQLSDPLVHLVRNSIDHGIEKTEKRMESGKDRKGKIKIGCKVEGSNIIVSISDDGAGLDYDAIRKKILSMWPENENEILHMQNDELSRFLFKSGFTTKEKSDELSGRGIGLDIVKTNIEKARGQIHLNSETGKGCTFTLILPVSASTMDGLYILCSGRKYFVPSQAIARTLLLDNDDCFLLREKIMFEFEGSNISLLELAEILQTTGESKKSGQKKPVLLVKGSSEICGLAVERILGYESLVFQPLPHCLRNNKLISGIVFDTSFQIIPVLNVWLVLDKFRSAGTMGIRKRFSSTVNDRKPSVLVVDDSISTREIEIVMLETEGFEVIGASDGVEALEKIRERDFDIIISDLNMPRMDGFKLLENIRNNLQKKDIPVLFVTTREDSESRYRAENLGADGYILKSGFGQDDLVGTIRGLLRKTGKHA